MSPKRNEIIPSADLLIAIKRVLVNKESQRQVSKDLNIPRSSLQRYLDSVKRTIPDVTAATDEDLLEILDTSTTIGAHSVHFHNFFTFFSIH